MNMVNTIDAPQYQHILINVLDRLVDFYVILYAARKNNHEIIPELADFRNSTESYLIEAGFTKQNLIDLNAINECLDIFQVNYSYCRPIYNEFQNATAKNNTIYQQLIQSIYEINSGNTVELVDNGFVIHPGTPEQQSLIKNIIADLKKRHPCLHLLRIADMVNAPKLEDLIPLIYNTLKSSRKLEKINHDDISNDSESIIETAINNIIKLVTFYPERLYPGLRYAFPQYDEPLNYDNLALSFSHQTSAADMQSALNDITFQFEKFKIYYHHHDINFIDDASLERLKPFISKPTRDNEYIKQTNSIEGTFHALFAWEKCHLDGLSQADAIHKAHLLFNESRDPTIKADDYKRKTRDRLKAIENHINKKASYIHALT